MSADPDDPDEFVTWLRERGLPAPAAPAVPRWAYGAYLRDVLAREDRPGSGVTVRQGRVVRIRDTGPDASVHLSCGERLPSDAVVLAVGTPPAPPPVPAALAASPRFVADPWADGALASVGGDEVVLLGAGLTAHDVALTLARAGRRVTTVSRTGRVPSPHRPVPSAAMSPPDLTACTRLDDVVNRLGAHLRRAVREFGDWRPGIDSLRPVSDEVWLRMPAADRERFLTAYLRRWDTLRHRMPHPTASRVAELRGRGGLRSVTGRVVAAEVGRDAVGLRLDDGRRMSASAVVDCTGASTDLTATPDELLASLLRDGSALHGPSGLGLAALGNGQVVAADGTPGRLWSVGALRRGSLWETTAVPEIRRQCAQVAEGIAGRAGAPEPVRASR